VKKVLTLLNMKGVEFAVDPITPFYGDDRFSKMSPLRRIPVFIDGDLVLNDSSVIAQYIEETWPTPAALPDTAAARARARWLEEYSDSRIGDVFIWKGFVAMVVAPRVFGTEPPVEAFKENLATGVVEVMDFLEREVPEDGFFEGAFGLADISIAAMFRVMKYTRWTPDQARWPKTCAWLSRAEAEPSLALANEWSDALAITPANERRRRAVEIGLAVTPESYAVKDPKRGPMTQVG